MKRFALAFGTLVLATQVTGCDSGGSSSSTGSAASSATVAHPEAQGEVKEYEAREAKRNADRIAKTTAGKSAKPGAGNP